MSLIRGALFGIIQTWQEPRKARKELWIKLAAEFESDQLLLNTLSEINFDEPFYAVPVALNLRVA